MKRPVIVAVTHRARAFRLGVLDGWEQPRDLSTSTNVDHLMTVASDEDTMLNWLDRGINVGQLAHAGLYSQAWEERYWPVSWVPPLRRSTCGYCGYGRRHRKHCPLRGWIITDAGPGWQA